MRVLHIASNIDPRSGGPAAVLAGLSTAQVRAGLDVSLITTYPAGRSVDVAEQLRASGVDVTVIGPCSGRLSRHPAIGPTLREKVPGVDVVHIHSLWEEIQHRAAVLCRKAGVPYIFRPCGMLDPYSLSRSAWLKKILLALRLRRDLNNASAIHYTADVERDLAQGLQLRSPSIVEPNGVDLGAYSHLPARGAFRQRFGIEADRPLVLFLSRIHPKKGLDLLIPAFAKVVESGHAATDRASDAMLVLAGPDDGGYRASVEQLIAKHGLGTRVIWTGMLQGEEKLSAYVDSDLFVLPSYQENFGIAIVEALASGTPVIISDQVAIWHELRAAGVAGVVPTQVAALADEMRSWLNDEGRRARAGEAGRTLALTKFSWDRIAARWQGHYQQLIAANGRHVS